MYTLHIANKNYSSWSLRPWILLRQLDIAFHEEMHPFQADIQAQRKNYLAFSPSAKVPVLQDGQTIVWDSLAIAEYLAEAHAGVWPEDRAARAWARSASSEMHAGFPHLRERCTMNCAVRATPKTVTAELQQDIERVNTLFNQGLARFGGPFLGGAAFTAVDAMYAPVVFRIQTYDLPMQGAAAEYVSRMLALPGMQQWYAQALQERDTDDAHEQDVVRYSDIIGDERQQ
ncbi:glutathione S-transferase family protein [Advenella mimigardefordensis]|uniref:Glutathione S-transferase domain-containing protein n=1 Tax=Advenella mimigardefordensis (strain DSM 17166 / LMG 22922 / DPN7) TaxID=1247726 RepID=W0PJ77_ADVMD|nr:glutathione S-transferase family protein [Advenella mimigardefordensis]AHG65068.1 glutathione S-transferase domain-containing protein [Advenella mimigardefordensis DPN7]